MHIARSVMGAASCTQHRARGTMPATSTHLLVYVVNLEEPLPVPRAQLGALSLARGHGRSPVHRRRRGTRARTCFWQPLSRRRRRLAARNPAAKAGWHPGAANGRASRRPAHQRMHAGPGSARLRHTSNRRREVLGLCRVRQSYAQQERAGHGAPDGGGAPSAHGRCRFHVCRAVCLSCWVHVRACAGRVATLYSARGTPKIVTLLSAMALKGSQT